MRGLPLVALIVFVVGCGAGTTNLPTHRDFEGGPTALFHATLAQRGECVVGVNPGSESGVLIIWPSGFSLRNTEVVDAGGQTVAAIGQVVKLGGGTYLEKEYDFLRTLMTADVPAACRTGNYFLATTVVR